MKKIVLLLILLSIPLEKLFSETVISSKQIFRFPASIQVKNQDNPQIITQGLLQKPVIIDQKELSRILGVSDRLIIKDFPVSPTELKSVTLDRCDPVIDGNTRFYKVTKNGKERMKPLSINSFYGKISDDAGSKVFLNYINGNLYCIVQNDIDETNFIAPVISDSKGESHLMLSTKYFGDENDHPFVCGTHDYDGIRTEKEDLALHAKENADEIQASKLLESPLIVEGAYNYFTMFGSDYDRAAAYMIAVISVISKIYQQEINVKFKVEYFQIIEDKESDPYDNLNLLSEKLNAMPSVWSTQGTKRALVSLFSRLSAQQGSQIAGIAMSGPPFEGTLCNKQRGYNVFGIEADGAGRYPTLKYTWDVSCAAHETGHSFSSPHTHNCYFKPNMIDTCVLKDKPYDGIDGCVETGGYKPVPGTIMSYCHLTNPTRNVQLYFHERCVPLLRKAAETATNCIGDAPQIVTLLSPLGEATYTAGSSIQIRWTSSKVSNINLKYTTDNGSTWIDLAANINAADSIYNWTLPMTNTTLAKVLIQNSANINIADTSWRTFTITSPNLTLTKPVPNGKYSNKTILPIEWQSTMITNVNIEWSANGGGSWQGLANNVQGGSYDWNVTGLSGDNYAIQLKNAANSQVVAGCKPLSIGNDFVKLLAPVGSEIWCGGWNYNILWDYNYTDAVYIQYSLDAGKTWKKVSPIPIVSTPKMYDWRVPKIVSDSAMVKIYSKYDTNAVSISPAVFKLDTCTKNSVNDDGIVIKNQPLRIIDIYPNPISSQSRIEILNSLNTDMPVNISIVDEKGCIAADLGSFELNGSRYQTIRVNIPELAQGSYFILLKSNANRANYPVLIIK